MNVGIFLTQIKYVVNPLSTVINSSNQSVNDIEPTSDENNIHSQIPTSEHPAGNQEV